MKGIEAFLSFCLSTQLLEKDYVKGENYDMGF
jgi:hypothetical protein